MLRAVVDVNVLVSAVLSPRGAPAAVVQAWQSGRFEIVASPALFAELEAVASRSRLSERLGDAGRALIDLLRATAILHDDPPAARVRASQSAMSARPMPDPRQPSVT